MMSKSFVAALFLLSFMEGSMGYTCYCYCSSSYEGTAYSSTCSSSACQSACWYSYCLTWSSTWGWIHSSELHSNVIRHFFRYCSSVTWSSSSSTSSSYTSFSSYYDSLSTSAVIAIIIGSVLGFAICIVLPIVLIGFFCCKKSSSRVTAFPVLQGQQVYGTPVYSQGQAWQVNSYQSPPGPSFEQQNQAKYWNWQFIYSFYRTGKFSSLPPSLCLLWILIKHAYLIVIK